MEETVFEARNLTKKYRHTLALDHINLSLQRGEIYGFIGENGAGKTTTIRLVTGLSFPTEGSISLFGKLGEKELQMQRARIGCMVETPALYKNMTAEQNLEAQRIQRGIPDRECIGKTLKLVGLSDTGKKSVRHFSLGMRQRLGIAMALLNDPEFLILDEPINGLDPSGIVEIRELMKRLNRERGITLLVSSHILSELYQTATRYILLHKGRVLEELTQNELDEKCKRHIAIKTNDASKTAAALENALHTTNFHVMPDNTVRLYDHLNNMEDVARILAQAGLLVTGLSLAGDSLENYFLHKIGGR
ncbi:ABC transporter ATP-binding protein [Caproicibacter fermentans]|uniref:ATP-binding cassette domain-containing protein n=1 Tax=Caproicibacter fermentans TaxID=2576756 RepID=A0A7G8TBG9_9FIRM|nr:ATP-binding cassette domain-containing protein [Caproicibacter fermentans]QNK40960.1 ATP-binding cassette domain-containing protein [Caproicibacter fermentans]